MKLIRILTAFVAMAILSSLSGRAQADGAFFSVMDGDRGDAIDEAFNLGLEGEASVEAYGSTGKFAPHLMSAMRHGTLTQGRGAQLDARVVKPMLRRPRLGWGFGAEVIAGAASKCSYERWSATTESWTAHRLGPSHVWLQQLYVEGKHRGVFVTLGMKERHSPVVNSRLSSGDLVESGNARPIPEIRVGFIDFQDIPFTRGWVQIQGEIAYGKMMDKGYLKDHYNYCNYHLALGQMYNYKRCYFRSNPSQPLSVMAGMQVGAFFGGTTYNYNQGRLESTRHFSRGLKTWLRMWLPIGKTGEDFYEGSTMGTWDFHARYRLPSGDRVAAYFEWPWEDGSGIGRRNGWDGLWGLEYRTDRGGWVKGAVIEYFDMRNQSGPLHWEPADHPGTTITSNATGRDNYYNNSYYNSYANYGMCIGTSMLPSPIYNLNGYPAFACNRLNGWHLGIEGNCSPTLAYRLLASWQRGLGTYMHPYYHPRKCASVMVEGRWDASAFMPGLSIKAQVAMDRGSLRGNNLGALVAVSYRMY